jgi:hypothetical protein
MNHTTVISPAPELIALIVLGKVRQKAFITLALEPYRVQPANAGFGCHPRNPE